MKISESFKKEWVLVVILLLLAIGTRFWAFGYPNRIVFDELYFAKFVSQYFLHSYYFDIHPPLAKLVMAGAAKISGINPTLTFGYNAINEAYPDSFYLLLRGIVSAFGALLSVGVYALSRSLRFSPRASFFAGFFVVFENALLVQSRFILTDAFLLTFGVFGLACVIFALREKNIRYPLLVAGSLLIGASYSVKWTGLLFLGMAGIYLIVRMFQTKNFLRYISPFLIIGGMSLLVYVSVFAIHLEQLDKMGPGDPFMTPRFQSTLIGNQNFTAPEFSENKPGFVEKFLELNTEMYSASAGITATHPYGSKWYTWPFMERGVYYWQNIDSDSHESKIYLLGNPLIWWIGLLGIVWLCGTGIYLLVRKKYSDSIPILFVCAGFFLNLAAYIPITRVAFLYHYFPSLIFLCVGLGYLVGKIKNKWIIGCVAAAVVISFIWMSPLSYGFPLTAQQFDSRTPVESWR